MQIVKHVAMQPVTNEACRQSNPTVSHECIRHKHKHVTNEACHNEASRSATNENNCARRPMQMKPSNNGDRFERSRSRMTTTTNQDRQFDWSLRRTRPVAGEDSYRSSPAGHHTRTPHMKPAAQETCLESGRATRHNKSFVLMSMIRLRPVTNDARHN